jgi:hypothetical protein
MTIKGKEITHDDLVIKVIVAFLTSKGIEMNEERAKKLFFVPYSKMHGDTDNWLIDVVAKVSGDEESSFSINRFRLSDLKL